MGTIKELGENGQDNNLPEDLFQTQTQTPSVRTKTTEGQCWIVPEREISNKIEIQFVPKDFTFSRTADMQAVKIIGRNNPLYQYAGGETNFTLSLDFYAQDEDRKDVLRTCKFLESLAINNGYSSPPQRIRIIFGQLFQDQMWVIKSAVYKLSNFDKPFGFLPKQAYMDLSLSLDTDSNITVSDIRKL